MSKGNDEPHKQQSKLQDYIQYIAVGDNTYSPVEIQADMQKEKDED
jgi:hypothetical protein